MRTGDEIACVPFVAEAPDVGRQATLDVQENLKLAMRLAQASLIRTLIGWNYKLRRFAPPTFVSRAPGRDLLALAAQGHEGELAGLHVYPQYCLDARKQLLHVDDLECPARSCGPATSRPTSASSIRNRRPAGHGSRFRAAEPAPREAWTAPPCA